MLDERDDDQPGDILSLYDPQQRRGWHLTVKTNAGVTFSQANTRQLQFGIDQGRDSDWTLVDPEVNGRLFHLR